MGFKNNLIKRKMGTEAIWKFSWHSSHITFISAGEGSSCVRYKNVYAYSCDIAPNKNEPNCKRRIRALHKDVREQNLVVIVSDFNAWALSNVASERTFRDLLNILAFIGCPILNSETESATRRVAVWWCTQPWLATH